jgi:O-antigen/teichoic acid export membrane protein
MAHSRQNDTPSEVIKIMKKAVILLSIIFGLWIICGALFGNHLLALIYSSKYAGYGSVLIIVILSSFISAVTGPLNSALDALERADISFKSLIAGLIVTVSVGIILTYQWGLYGAVIGMLLSNLTNCLLRWRGLFTLINDFKARVANVSLP